MVVCIIILVVALGGVGKWVHQAIEYAFRPSTITTKSLEEDGSGVELADASGNCYWESRAALNGGELNGSDSPKFRQSEHPKRQGNEATIDNDAERSTIVASHVSSPLSEIFE